MSETVHVCFFFFYFCNWKGNNLFNNQKKEFLVIAHEGQIVFQI